MRGKLCLVTAASDGKGHCMRAVESILEIIYVFRLEHVIIGATRGQKQNHSQEGLAAI